MKHFVITIARGFGSGGKQIGTELGRQLGIPCYEKQILQMASEQTGIAEKMFAEVDEKLKGKNISSWLRAVSTSNVVVEPSDKDFTSNNNLFNIQREIIRSLAETESCIIIGKCADYILKDYPNVISIYIEAPRAACVKSIMEKMQVIEEKAHELISKTDKYRANYYRYYTGGNTWTNPINYDMTLNSDTVGREKCVEVIKSYIDIKFDK